MDLYTSIIDVLRIPNFIWFFGIFGKYKKKKTSIFKKIKKNKKIYIFLVRYLPHILSE
jgi:hypothetical protein